MPKVCKTPPATKELNFPIKVRERHRTTKVDGVLLWLSVLRLLVVISAGCTSVPSRYIHLAITGETVFHVASVSKQITVMCIFYFFLSHLHNELYKFLYIILYLQAGFCTTMSNIV